VLLFLERQCDRSNPNPPSVRPPPRSGRRPRCRNKNPTELAQTAGQVQAADRDSILTQSKRWAKPRNPGQPPVLCVEITCPPAAPPASPGRPVGRRLRAGGPSAADPSGRRSVALPLCTTVQPLYTIFTNSYLVHLFLKRHCDRTLRYRARGAAAVRGNADASPAVPKPVGAERWRVALSAACRPGAEPPPWNVASDRGSDQDLSRRCLKCEEGEERCRRVRTPSDRRSARTPVF
jgi:hypothetical protein